MTSPGPAICCTAGDDGVVRCRVLGSTPAGGEPGVPHGDWQVAMRPGKRRKLEPGSDEAVAEKEKASVRAKVEQPFLKVKRIFDYGKVPYRGLAKNTRRLALLLGLGQPDDSGGSTGGLTWRPAGPNQASRPFQAPAIPAEAKSAATDTRQQGHKAGHNLKSWPFEPNTGRTWSCSEHS